jgi:hypothetical protein
MRAVQRHEVGATPSRAAARARSGQIQRLALARANVDTDFAIELHRHGM